MKDLTNGRIGVLYVAGHKLDGKVFKTRTYKDVTMVVHKYVTESGILQEYVWCVSRLTYRHGDVLKDDFGTQREALAWAEVQLEDNYNKYIKKEKEVDRSITSKVRVLAPNARYGLTQYGYIHIYVTKNKKVIMSYYEKVEASRFYQKLNVLVNRVKEKYSDPFMLYADAGKVNYREEHDKFIAWSNKISK
tara:strand:+ start:1809 stop:2381 length:573 start_codon:yes stop_codon:yes gene_type:complete